MSKITGIPPQVVAKLDLPELPKDYFWKFSKPMENHRYAEHKVSICYNWSGIFRKYKVAYAQRFSHYMYNEYGEVLSFSWANLLEKAAERTYNGHRQKIQREDALRRSKRELDQLWSFDA